MLKRKQLQEQQESERRELGLESEDLECISSDSGSDMEESGCDSEISEEETLKKKEGDIKPESSKTKVMILGSRGINSRYFFEKNSLFISFLDIVI